MALTPFSVYEMLQMARPFSSPQRPNLCLVQFWDLTSSAVMRYAPGKAALTLGKRKLAPCPMCADDDLDGKGDLEHKWVSPHKPKSSADRKKK